ncbi:MAG: cation:proton antiporter [Acidimicrobiia bacterium]
MDDNVLVALAAIVVLGVGCQWVAAKLRLPSIVLLLIAGILAGPVTGLIEPDELFGETLFPGVSLAVGLLLFDSGLGLRFDDLAGGVRRPVIRLITIGVLITGCLTAAAAFLIFDLPFQFALLLGAILVVSGPTVVGPILSLARPREPAGSVLNWEGTFVDPIGAALGILVLNVVVLDDASPLHQGPDTIAVGILVGLVAAALLVASLRWFLIPDDLEVGVAVLFAVAAFATADTVQSEAGLMSCTVLGVALANQPWVPVNGISFFHRSLGSLIIGSLFIVLAARIDLGDLVDIIPGAAVLLAVLVIVIRPAAAFAATAFSSLPIRDRAFIAWMAPRGIVAAATASLFTLQIEDNGKHFDDLVPITFAVIIGTAVVYGLSAYPVARLLGVSRGRPQGIVLVGRRPWLLSLASELSSAGVDLGVVATGAYDLEAEIEGFEIYTGPLTEEAMAEVLDGKSHVLVASDNDEHNLLAARICIDVIGRSGVFVLPHSDLDVREAREPFSARASQEHLENLVSRGATFTTLDDEGFVARAEDGRMAAVLIGPDGSLRLDPGSKPLRKGEILVALDGFEPA